MPVSGLGKFLLDDITNEQYFAASQQIADDKGSQRRDKHHRNTADNARNGKGQCDSEKCLYSTGAQIPGSIDDVFVYFSKCVV